MNFDKAIDILQLNQKYSSSELKRQYYSRALFYHPDKNKSNDATERFQEINDAYTFLTDYKSDKNTTYDSLFNRLLKLPEKTLVYPAHDYNGKKNSTIKNEKNNNPRLQVSSKEEYAEIMNNLNLANPKMMDIAVPANLKGLTLNQL